MPVIAYFDPGFRFPRSLKVALGLDQRLPWGMVGTVDILYARGVNQFAERDVNLVPPLGDGGRRRRAGRSTGRSIRRPASREPARRMPPSVP